MNEQNPLLNRALDLTKAVQEYFDGRMAIGFPDFGGVMDIVSSLRDANPFLMECALEPEDVEEACLNIHEQFKKAYGMFMDVIDEDHIPGYTCWATMLSQKPYFVLQNDFSAMIKPITFIGSAIGAYIVCYIINQFLGRKVKKIDMVTSLKGNE